MCLANWVDKQPYELEHASGGTVEERSDSIFGLLDFTTDADEEDEGVMNDQDLIAFLASRRATRATGRISREEAKGITRESCTSPRYCHSTHSTTQTNSRTSSVSSFNGNTNPNSLYSLLFSEPADPCAAPIRLPVPEMRHGARQSKLELEMEKMRPVAFTVMKRGFIFHQELPSVGSAMHFYNGCIPCDYMGTEEGCTMGRYCGFCHYCPALGVCDHKRRPRRESAILFEAALREEREILEEHQCKTRCTDITNIGSRNHYEGTCDPCVFIHKDGCNDGEDCRYCHICDTDMCRIKKATRGRVGRRIKTVCRKDRLEESGRNKSQTSLSV